MDMPEAPSSSSFNLLFRTKAINYTSAMLVAKRLAERGETRGERVRWSELEHENDSKFMSSVYAVILMLVMCRIYEFYDRKMQITSGSRQISSPRVGLFTHPATPSYGTQLSCEGMNLVAI